MSEASADNQAKYDAKLQRIRQATALQEADRVPFAPKVSGFYANGYGIDMYEMMKDLRTAEPGIRQYLADYDPDLVWPVVTYPIDPVETLGAVNIITPGPTHGLPLKSSFQFLDGTYLEDEEFNEFLLDPTHFMLTKVMPRKNKHLGAFTKLYLREIYDQAAIMELSVFSQDDVRKALYALVRAGEYAQASKEQSGYMAQLIKAAGYPMRGGTTLAPFDIYADSLRGLIRAIQDIYERPAQTLAVVERIADLSVDRAVAAARARGDICTFIPLHSGVDEFMSRENYRKFYWPGLQRIINGLIDAGITPFVFCEGKYNTRLDIISEVPKGKVIYLFEEVDIRRVKQTVGQVACFCGNIPAALLEFGRKERVIEETKKMLDICAPGGGFIMDCSIIMDNANHENMQAWRQTTLEYGVY